MVDIGAAYITFQLQKRHAAAQPKYQQLLIVKFSLTAKTGLGIRF